MSWFIGRSSGAMPASASSSSSRIGTSSSPARAHATSVCPNAGPSTGSPRARISSSSRHAPCQSETCAAACTMARHSPRLHRSAASPVPTLSHSAERIAAHTPRSARRRASASLLPRPSVAGGVCRRSPRPRRCPPHPRPRGRAAGARAMTYAERVVAPIMRPPTISARAPSTSAARRSSQLRAAAAIGARGGEGEERRASNQGKGEKERGEKRGKGKSTIRYFTPVERLSLRWRARLVDQPPVPRDGEGSQGPSKPIPAILGQLLEMEEEGKTTTLLLHSSSATAPCSLIWPTMRSGPPSATLDVNIQWGSTGMANF